MNAAEAQNWIAGIALVITGFGLLREVRSRNRDRRDAEAGQARTVVTITKAAKPGISMTAMTATAAETTITNYSAAPILNLWVGVGHHSRAEEAPGEYFPILGPSQSVTTTQPLKPTLPWTDDLDPAASIETVIHFTDANGLQWIRRDNDGPYRWIDPTRPVWWLRLRYRLEDRVDRIRPRRS
ncbi:hypothetical protein [Micromonospora coerulea]|uniref:hypothetical protein n=1 Tax=Micromonospora coerulea TaxID=47856 RepID=UPI00190850E5|nr:hypothetical protein [Micromonospora veneta]